MTVAGLVLDVPEWTGHILIFVGLSFLFKFPEDIGDNRSTESPPKAGFTLLSWFGALYLFVAHTGVVVVFLILCAAWIRGFGVLRVYQWVLYTQNSDVVNNSSRRYFFAIPLCVFIIFSFGRGLLILLLLFDVSVNIPYTIAVYWTLATIVTSFLGYLHRFRSVQNSPFQVFELKLSSVLGISLCLSGSLVYNIGIGLGSIRILAASGIIASVAFWIGCFAWRGADDDDYDFEG